MSSVHGHRGNAKWSKLKDIDRMTEEELDRYLEPTRVWERIRKRKSKIDGVARRRVDDGTHEYSVNGEKV